MKRNLRIVSVFFGLALYGSEAYADDAVQIPAVERPSAGASDARSQSEQATTAPPALGVSSRSRARMRFLLREAADAAQRRRLLIGPAGLTLGLGLAATGALTLEKGIRTKNASRDIAGSAMIAGGTLVSITEAVRTFRPSLEERIYETFVSDSALSSEHQEAQTSLHRAERALLGAANDDATARNWARWIGLAIFGTYGTALTYGIIDARGDLSQLSPAPVAVFGGIAAFGASAFVDSFFPTTTERMASLWKYDPDAVTTQRESGLRVQPVFGPVSAGIVGTF